jgi:hypothetical protein
MAEYRIKSGYSGEVALVPRSAVKRWVFDSMNDLVVPLCQLKAHKTAEKRRIDDNTVTERKASFVYVDDRIVQAAMIEYWGLEKPKPGAGYEYGLRDHSWQALAVATVWRNQRLQLP